VALLLRWLKLLAGVLLTVTLAAHQRNPAGGRANFYPTGLNDSVVASAYEPSVPL